MNLIREAMGIMAKRGMCQYTQLDYSGRVCVVGAVNLAADGRTGHLPKKGSQSYRALLLISEVAKEQFPERAYPAMEYPSPFNDHDNTIIDDVLRVMDKAAVRLDEAV